MAGVNSAFTTPTGRGLLIATPAESTWVQDNYILQAYYIFARLFTKPYFRYFFHFFENLNTLEDQLIL